MSNGPLGVCPHLRFKLVLTLVRYQSFYITLHKALAEAVPILSVLYNRLLLEL